MDRRSSALILDVMTKRSNNLDTVQFSLHLLKRIPRGRKVTTVELQSQLADAGFERDLRTIQRQLEALSEHFDIERDTRNKPYGYSWKSHGAGFSLPSINEQEAVLLTLAQQHLQNLLPAHLMKSMDAFFQQARLTLNHGASDSAKAWQRKVRVIPTSQKLLPPKTSMEVFEAVSQALYADHWLEVSYVNAGGKRSDAKVMPLGLAQQGARLLLACRFDGHDDVRALAVHRLQSAKDTGMPFKRPADFDLQAYEEDGRFGFSTGKRISLVFRLPKLAGVHLTESPLSPDQTVRESAGGYEFTATVTESEQLKWWLRGFGADLELISPRGLLAP
ncbi:helix-turn-helix transcriptional regulator [Aquincola tertiaricarbonis]|uniref:helix-turn-helix transcriptional regulator n=1 Tax=Aquincola tertiaricarbonis TaxID=391953 RepID=UPI001E5C60F7|nr:WYL domain-containing protein [Aquincola tertiaricarbonis]